MVASLIWDSMRSKNNSTVRSVTRSYKFIECYKLFTQLKTIAFQNPRSSLFINLATVQKLLISTSNRQKRLTVTEKLAEKEFPTQRLHRSLG